MGGNKQHCAGLGKLREEVATGVLVQRRCFLLCVLCVLCDFKFKVVKSRIVTSLVNLKFSKQVRAFIEHGALMAAGVLNTKPWNVRSPCCVPREHGARHARARGI